MANGGEGYFQARDRVQIFSTGGDCSRGIFENYHFKIGFIRGGRSLRDLGTLQVV